MAKEHPPIGDRVWGSKFENEVLWPIGRKLSDSIEALKFPDSSSRVEIWLPSMWVGGGRVELPVEELRKHPEAFYRYESEILKLLQLLHKRVPPTDTSFPFAFGMDFIRSRIKEFEDLVVFHQAAKSGKHSKEGGRKGGIVRGKQQTTNREKEWEKWQAEADKIWKKHLTWGKHAVAKMVHEKFPGVTVRTIRLRIKNPAM